MNRSNSRAGDASGSRGSAEALRVAGVAHDVNQMLAVIIGRAELLLAREPELRGHLEAVLLAARDAVKMLGRLGAAGASSSGPVTCVRRAVDEAAHLILPPSANWESSPGMGGGWVFENRVDPEIGTRVPASALREVLANLLTNALQSMPRGGSVSISAVCSSDAVALSVADTGPGVASDLVESIFEPGFTSSGQVARGIGLAACRQLLADFGGTLEVAPNEGQGAVFVVGMPWAPAQACDAHAVEGASPVGTTSVEGPVVMVVDDEPAVREMLTEVLAALGCRVKCHRDGPQTLAGYERGEATVALIDRQLPGMGGAELAGRLRNRDPDLVIVQMTGWGRTDGATGIDPAVVDFSATKPMEMSELNELLTRAVALRAERRAATREAGS